MNNDLISRSALIKWIDDSVSQFGGTYSTDMLNMWGLFKDYLINNAPTVEETEEPFVTECRETAIKENLPLYFVYYEETGIFEVYITKTKELFEKRHCSKYLSNYKFREIVTNYLDWYFDWKDGSE